MPYYLGNLLQFATPGGVAESLVEAANEKAVQDLAVASSTPKLPAPTGPYFGGISANLQDSIDNSPIQGGLSRPLMRAPMQPAQDSTSSPVTPSPGMTRVSPNLPAAHLSVSSTEVAPSAAPQGEQGEQGLVSDPMKTPSGQGQGKQPPAPAEPSMVDVKAETETTRKDYLPADLIAVGEAEPTLQKASEHLMKIRGEFATDPAVVKQVDKMLTSNLSVEAALDPTGKEAQTYLLSLKDIREKLDKANADTAKFQEEARIDPDRYMKNMPAMEKLSSALSIFIENMAMAKAIGKGVAVPPIGLLQQQLDRAIDRDIAFQKEELASKGNAKVTQANRYKENLALLGNERAAELKTKLDYQAANQAVYQQMFQNYQGKIDEATGKEILASNALKMAQTKRDLGMSTIKTATQSQAMGGKPGFTEEQARVNKASNDLHADYTARTKDAHDKYDKTSLIESTIARAKTGDAAAMNELAGLFVKQAQGGTGTISDNDIKVFGLDKGILENIETFFKGKIGGVLPERVIDSLTAFKDRMKDNASKVIAETAYDTMLRAKQLKIPEEEAQAAVPFSARMIYKDYAAKSAKKSGKPIGG